VNYNFPFFGQRVVLSGDVFFLRFVVSASEEKQSDERLWSFLHEMRHELESDIKEAIEKFLSPEFEVRSITFHGGSIEILVVIGTAYYVISRYKNFIESVELLLSHLKRIIHRFFGRLWPQPISVYGTWSPGPALVRAETLYSSYGSMDAIRILLWYLILSHAALLTVVIWMIVRR
jgi:hypothetical protein